MDAVSTSFQSVIAIHQLLTGNHTSLRQNLWTKENVKTNFNGKRNQIYTKLLLPPHRSGWSHNSNNSVKSEVMTDDIININMCLVLYNIDTMCIILRILRILRLFPCLQKIVPYRHAIS